MKLDGYYFLVSNADGFVPNNENLNLQTEVELVFYLLKVEITRNLGKMADDLVRHSDSEPENDDESKWTKIYSRLASIKKSGIAIYEPHEISNPGLRNKHPN